PTGAPVPTAAPWPTEAPAATTAATARPAQAVRQYLPYSAQRALPTGMPTPTATRVIAMPTATATAAGTVEILDVVLRDPSFPDSSEEYVEIHNMGRSAVTIGGWRLSNASRAGTVPPYVFPSYTLGADMSIAVFSSVGDDDLVIGDFYWDRAGDVWRVGDRAELRDALNNLISTLIVPSQ
ncbi:MAG: lamin tail domain-containing protein, partial [Chloroflexales bacterium]|nr:lamin tail domain-containing protein [Chloroflexales bacterium]